MGGNLGLYLWLTRIAKKLGGPVAFVIMLVAGGVLIGLGAEAAIKRIVKALRKENRGTQPIVYTASHEASNDDFVLRAGDQFSVLMQDDEYALIERLGDETHRIVPTAIISDFLSDTDNA